MARRGKRIIHPPIGNISDANSLYNHMLRFIEWIKVKQFSETTVISREIYLRKFIYWCVERSLSKPQEITRPILERYQRHLFLRRKTNGQPLGVHTQLTHLHAIRAWFKWLTRNNHILYNPASDLELPKKQQQLPRDILTVSEAETIFNQANINTPIGIRDRAMLEVLYSTGMRRMELCNLKVTDIDYNREVVMIRQGKGHKDRVVPIGQRAILWIKKYLNEVRPQMVVGLSAYALFLNTHGEPMVSSWLSRLVSKYIKQANVGKTGSCHLFRHTMATLMLENGADIRYIQAMLGHAKLDTTQIYTQVSIQKLKDIHTATHPAKHKPKQQQESTKEPPESTTFH